MLWPDAEPSARAARLRWLLKELRKLGLPLDSTSTEVGLASNVVELQTDDLESMEPGAVGEILPNYGPSLSAMFEDWLRVKTRAISTRVIAECDARARGRGGAARLASNDWLG